MLVFHISNILYILYECCGRMKLSTKGRYAVIAMIDIAIYMKEDTNVSLYQISQRCNISVSYLEQLFIKLKKAGLVDSSKGPKGGYKLSKSSAEISVASIMDAVDEKIEFLKCNKVHTCLKDGKHCSTHYLWLNFMNAVYGYLDGVSLDNIVKNQVSAQSLSINNL